MIINIGRRGLLHGAPLKLAAEYTVVSAGLLKALSKTMEEEKAREVMEECFRLAMSEVLRHDES